MMGMVSVDFSTPERTRTLKDSSVFYIKLMEERKVPLVTLPDPTTDSTPAPTSASTSAPTTPSTAPVARLAPWLLLGLVVATLLAKW